MKIIKLNSKKIKNIINSELMNENKGHDKHDFSESQNIRSNNNHKKFLYSNKNNSFSITISHPYKDETNKREMNDVGYGIIETFEKVNNYFYKQIRTYK